MRYPTNYIPPDLCPMIEFKLERISVGTCCFCGSALLVRYAVHVVGQECQLPVA